MILSRRSLIVGAPAVVAASSLMPVRSIARLLTPPNYYVGDGDGTLHVLGDDGEWVHMGTLRNFTFYPSYLEKHVRCDGDGVLLIKPVTLTLPVHRDVSFEEIEAQPRRDE